MEKRKTFTSKVKQHNNAIINTVVLLIAVALFISGFVVSWIFWQKPLSDKQFKACEQVIRDIYAQSGNVIVESPEDFSVSVSTTATTITVETASNPYRGKVIAEMHDGELIMTRYMETGEAIFASVIIGVSFVIAAIIAIVIIDGIINVIFRRH